MQSLISNPDVPPKLAALDKLLSLSSKVAGDISTIGRSNLAQTMRLTLSLVSSSPNKYDLAIDITSISGLIDDLGQPAGNPVEIATALHARVYSLHMRVFEMLRDIS